MLRSFSIVIFSSFAVSLGFGQTVPVTVNFGVEHRQGITSAGNMYVTNMISFGPNWATVGTFRSGSSYTVGVLPNLAVLLFTGQFDIIFIPRSSFGASNNVANVSSSGFTLSSVTDGVTNYVSGFPQSYVPPEEGPFIFSDEVEYAAQLGSEYDGLLVRWYDQDGNILGEHLVGPEGLSLSGNILVNSPNPVTAGVRVEIFRPGPSDAEGLPTWASAGGFDLDRDGGVASVPTWTESGEVMPIGTTFQRNGNTWTSLGEGNFAVTGSFFRSSSASIHIGDQYGGGRWSLVNSAGGEVTSGDIPSGGGPVTWSGTVTAGDGQLSFVVQNLVVGPDGMPSLGPPVNIGAGSGSVAAIPPVPVPFVPSGPSVPSAPVPSVPADPVSGPSSDNNFGTTAPGSNLAEDETATVEEDTTDYMDNDDGEGDVLEKAAGIAETWEEIFEELYKAQEILSGIGAKWEQAASTGPESIGATCTFPFGPSVSVNLSPFTRYRPATAAFGWFMAALALYTMTNAALRK